MKNVRFLQIVILVLIVINLGTLGFVWFRSTTTDKPAKRSIPAGFLVKELELSASQRDKYAGMRRNHMMEMKKLQEDDRMLHNRFFEQLFSEVPDPHIVHDLADSISLNRKKMEMLTYEHFDKIHQMLDPGQQKKFEKIFDEVLRMVLPPPPPLPPPADVPPPPPAPPLEK